MSQHMFRSNDLHGPSLDPIVRDALPMRSGAYGLDDISGFGARSEPMLSALPTGLTRGYPSFEDPIPPSQRHPSFEDPVLSSQRRELSAGITPVPPVIPDMVYDRSSSQQQVNGPSIPPAESNILFVDGLPTDCTRREVGHIFRPFIGFKDIKVIHKEPRQRGDKPVVLCFVEFDNARCAVTAMEALQGYKFDDKKPNSSIIKIHFAHFPFRLPAEREDQRLTTH